MRKIKYIIGIDEVGRGSLAGPVTVAALALPLLSSPRRRGSRTTTLDFRLRGNDNKLRDSKKLSPKQREEWLQFIKQRKIHYAVASASPKIIDKINISQAANLAATKALIKLMKISEFEAYNCEVFLDGGLFLRKRKNFPFFARTIIRADEKIPAVSLASIVAKVHRDKLMKQLHKKYPRYDFFNNVGYGTSKHIAVIKKFGRSKIHRKSFSITR